MESIRIEGFVDGQHQLTVSVPGSIPSGPVTVLIESAPSTKDDADEAWMSGVARAWAEDLADVRQDIYTLSDGDALDET